MWTNNTNNESLVNFKKIIVSKLLGLGDIAPDEVKLHFINENINIEELGIDSEEAFQKYLKSCIISNCLNIKIQVSTQQRPFTEWCEIGYMCVF